MEAIDLTLADVAVPKDHAIDLANKENEEGGDKSETSKRKGLGKGSNIQEFLKHHLLIRLSLFLNQMLWPERLTR
jgi:hypothetical protein